jgi:hypothetical protein
VVFGSPPFFASDKRRVFLRFHGLTNPDDPRSSSDFTILDRDIGPLMGPRFDYASMGDAMAVQRLTAFFGSAGVVLRAFPAHSAGWETIKDNNVILLGASRTHPLMRRLPMRQDFELGADNQIHNHRPQPGEQAIYTTTSHHDTMTYAVLAAFAGLKPGREMLVIMAHSSPGVVGAVDFATSRGSVRVINEQVRLTTGRRYFQMLLRIYVDHGTSVRTEYVTHHLNPQ